MTFHLQQKHAATPTSPWAPDANRLVNDSLSRAGPAWRTWTLNRDPSCKWRINQLLLCWILRVEGWRCLSRTPLPVNPEGLLGGLMLRSSLLCQPLLQIPELKTLIGILLGWESFSKLQQRERRTTASHDLLMVPGNDLTPTLKFVSKGASTKSQLWSPPPLHGDGAKVHTLVGVTPPSVIFLPMESFYLCDYRLWN